jgi:hypothetical protein
MIRHRNVPTYIALDIGNSKYSTLRQFHIKAIGLFLTKSRSQLDVKLKKITRYKDMR